MSSYYDNKIRKITNKTDRIMRKMSEKQLTIETLRTLNTHLRYNQNQANLNALSYTDKRIGQLLREIDDAYDLMETLHETKYHYITLRNNERTHFQNQNSKP